MLQEPYTLAEFPKNLIAPNGKILVADVYGLLGARKRKRSELAVALDNDSVNLYDVCASTPTWKNNYSLNLILDSISKAHHILFYFARGSLYLSTMLIPVSITTTWSHSQTHILLRQRPQTKIALLLRKV